MRRGRRKRAWQKDGNTCGKVEHWFHSSLFILIHLHSSAFIRKFSDSAVYNLEALLQFKLLAGSTRMRSTKTKAWLPIATWSAPSDFLSNFGSQQAQGTKHPQQRVSLPTTSVPPKTNLSLPSFRTSLASNHLPFPARSCQNDVLEVAAASQRIAAANHSQEASSHLATAPPNITRTERSSQELDVFQILSTFSTHVNPQHHHPLL